jgi:large subunit ribosomal protein L21
MYAVVQTGGKQYKVRQGEVLRVERLSGKRGAQVTFDKVLLYSDGETVRVGHPTLDDVTVNGTIVEQGKEKKILVFKYKRRKRYRRKQGHRQDFTAVKIDTIGTGEAAKASSESEPAPAADVDELVQKPADAQTDAGMPDRPDQG